MINIFFYNKLNNINNIKTITNKYDCIPGYIFVNSFDSNKDKLIIGNNNTIILKGLVVTFYMPLNELLIKLSNINDIKYKKSKYLLEKINVITYDKGIINCYIIC